MYIYLISLLARQNKIQYKIDYIPVAIDTYCTCIHNVGQHVTQTRYPLFIPVSEVFSNYSLFLPTMLIPYSSYLNTIIIVKYRYLGNFH